MGRRGKIQNCVDSAFAARFAAGGDIASLAEETAEACGKWRCFKSSIPLWKSGPAFDRMRSCALRIAAAAGLTRGLWRSGRKARAAERRCADPVAARVRIAAPPVLPDGGRPVGTAWKDSKLRRFCICRPLCGGDAASLCWPQFLFVLRMPARVRLRLSV